MAALLLIEDNELNRDMLARRLVRKGHLVTFAMDGAEGVEKARSENPELILLDMSLPVMDGWTVARNLKADELTRSIPIIALTAHAMSGERERALEVGCDEFDVKPIDFERLLGKINQLLAPPDAES